MGAEPHCLSKTFRPPVLSESTLIRENGRTTLVGLTTRSSGNGSSRTRDSSPHRVSQGTDTGDSPPLGTIRPSRRSDPKPGKPRPDHRRTLAAADAVAAAAQPVVTAAPPPHPPLHDGVITAAQAQTGTPRPPSGNRTKDVVALGAAAAVLLGFAAVLVFGPASSDTRSSGTTTGSTPTTTSLAGTFSDSVTRSDAYPRCSEVAGATSVVTCTRGNRTLTLVPPGVAAGAPSYAAIISDARLRGSGPGARQHLEVSMHIGNRLSEPRRPTRSQMYLSLSRNRYTARSVRAGGAVPPNGEKSVRVTFSIPTEVARRWMRAGDTVTVAVAGFGSNAQTAKALLLLRTTVG